MPAFFQPILSSPSGVAVLEQQCSPFSAMFTLPPLMLHVPRDDYEFSPSTMSYTHMPMVTVAVVHQEHLMGRKRQALQRMAPTALNAWIDTCGEKFAALKTYRSRRSLSIFLPSRLSLHHPDALSSRVAWTEAAGLFTFISHATPVIWLGALLITLEIFVVWGTKLPWLVYAAILGSSRIATWLLEVSVFTELEK